MQILQYFLILWIILGVPSPSWSDQERYDPKPVGAVSVMMGGPVIDELALKDADIAQALEIIAKKSGLNIITGANVKGKVSVFLKHVNAREALRIVLESNALAYADEGSIVRVMTAEEYLSKFGYPFGQDKDSKLIRLNFISARDALKFVEEMKSPLGKAVINEEAKTILLVDSKERIRLMEQFLADLDVPVTTQTFLLKNVQADTLVAEIKRMLTQSVGRVEANMATNTLVVTDTVARVERVRKAIESIDARGRVMILEAKLVHVVLNDEHPQGIDWAGIVEDYQRVRLVGKYDFLTGTDSGRALSFGMISNDDFATLIEALDTVGVVQEYPLSTIRVAGDEQIRLVLHLDDPSLDMSLEISGDENDDIRPAGGVSLAFMVKPSFDVTGEVSTSVVPQEVRPMTKDPAYLSHVIRGGVVGAHEGYTAVLGGMIVTARTSPAHKIPLLGDLPILGFAFRMEGSVRKEEFIIFLTPKSISLSQVLADEGTSSGLDEAGGE
jgi:type II secretory pathway component GspD/PulD (secretin)